MRYVREPDVTTAACIDERIYLGCSRNVVGVLIRLTARFRPMR